MSAGEQSYRAAEKHARDAVAALEAGDMERARVQAQLAEASSRLALAAALVLSTDPAAAGSYRMAVGGLDL